MCLLSLVSYKPILSVSQFCEQTVHKIRTRGRVKISKNVADVIYGSPQRLKPPIKNVTIWWIVGAWFDENPSRPFPRDSSFPDRCVDPVLIPNVDVIYGWPLTALRRAARSFWEGFVRLTGELSETKKSPAVFRVLQSVLMVYRSA